MLGSDPELTGVISHNWVRDAPCTRFNHTDESCEVCVTCKLVASSIHSSRLRSTLNDTDDSLLRIAADRCHAIVDQWAGSGKSNSNGDKARARVCEDSALLSQILEFVTANPVAAANMLATTPRNDAAADPAASASTTDSASRASAHVRTVVNARGTPEAVGVQGDGVRRVSEKPPAKHVCQTLMGAGDAPPCSNEVAPAHAPVSMFGGVKARHVSMKTLLFTDSEDVLDFVEVRKRRVG